MALAKPATLHDRDAEWAALARFATDARPGPTLGVVYGRRRQGKTYLLDALTARVGGMLHVAVQDVAPRALADVGATLARHIGAPVPLAFPDWPSVVDALLDLGAKGGPVVAVLDELPYLTASSPELPSVIQRALGPGSPRAQTSQTRLIVCGSAMSVMSGLLTGTAPLRGRAALELIVHPFDYRETATFWKLGDPELAVTVHAVVGGTPAYRDLLREDAPESLGDFDNWVIRAVLDPASPLAREGRYLLAEEPSITDRALYHAILTAIAEGRTRRGQIAQAVGRPDNQLSHPLNVLRDLRLVTQRDDVLRARRPTFAITEPIMRFHHAIVRPQTSRLERGQITQAWRAAAPTFRAQILGPHFEELAREWTGRIAEPETIGGDVDQVGATVVTDPKQRRTYEVDVVALGVPDRGRRPLLLLGEAKWQREPLGVGDLARLERVRSLLDARDDLDARATRLALFSRSGFDRSVESRSDVVLVDLERLFEGV
ncbi:MAG: ATP-binding protein [Egibacteraceae bacterium]